MSENTLTQIPYRMAQIIVNNYDGERHRIQRFDTGDRHADEIHEFVVVDGYGLYFCDHPTVDVDPMFGDPETVEKYFETRVAAYE